MADSLRARLRAAERSAAERAAARPPNIDVEGMEDDDLARFIELGEKLHERGEELTEAEWAEVCAFYERYPVPERRRA